MSNKPIRIGYSLSLSGILAANGKTALLAHKLWEEKINSNGGLLGRPVQLVCIDDQTNPSLVPDIYKKLLSDEKVDLVIGGYGDNSIKPAMPLVMEQKKFFVGLMGLAVNQEFNYENYFVMIPTGLNPGVALTEGFFSVASKQNQSRKRLRFFVQMLPFQKALFRVQNRIVIKMALKLFMKRAIRCLQQIFLHSSARFRKLVPIYYLCVPM